MTSDKFQLLREYIALSDEHDMLDADQRSLRVKIDANVNRRSVLSDMLGRMFENEFNAVEVGGRLIMVKIARLGSPYAYATVSPVEIYREPVSTDAPGPGDFFDNPEVFDGEGP